MFHNVQGEFKGLIALTWFATESCIQLIKHALRWRISQSLSWQKCWKARIICYTKDVKNPATFVDGFWSVFYARGRFMKYSMSGRHCQQKFLRIVEFFGFWSIIYSYFGIKPYKLRRQDWVALMWKPIVLFLLLYHSCFYNYPRWS